MEKTAKGCGYAIGVIVLGIFLAFWVPRIVNNFRANRLIAQFDNIETVLNQHGLIYKILETSRQVKYDLGSALDCEYSAGRTYESAWPESEDAFLLDEISKLHLAPYKPRADGKPNSVTIQRSETAVTFIIHDGSWETMWAFLDVRCW